MKNIPFTRPYLSGNEQKNILSLLKHRFFAEGGPFSSSTEGLLLEITGAKAVFLTSSGTSALELMCMTAGLEPGDEVILPSFTYPSTANAILRVDAVPVFVDIRKDIFNLDENLIEEAITEKTRAIMPVHYGGVACNMDKILDIADSYGLIVLEDAAQSIDAWYGSSHLGTLGQMGAFSFHETKNIQCGQGGALLLNDEKLVSRAEIIYEHGTNRRQFFRKETDHYSWQECGSSFAMPEISAAFLAAQLGSLPSVTKERRQIWQRYHEFFARYEKEGFLRRPIVPEYCIHNGHCYPVLFPSGDMREMVRTALLNGGVAAHFHYVPLHSSPMGRKLSDICIELPVTENVSDCLLRMPLYSGLDIDESLRRIEDVLQRFPGRKE